MPSTARVQSISEEEAARLRVGSDSQKPARSPDEGGTSVEDSISADELFHVLENSRRRAVIRYLRGREGPVEMRDVAEQVAAWEHDTTVAQLHSAERQRVYIALYQSHLETLADAGIIAYDKPRGVIEPQPVLDQVASYLDIDVAGPTDGDEAPWPERPRAVAVGLMLLVGTALSLAGLGLLSWILVSTLLLGLFSGRVVTKLLLKSSANG